jgi:hypothetical protein
MAKRPNTRVGIDSLYWKSARGPHRTAGELRRGLKKSCRWPKKKSFVCLCLMLDFLCFARSFNDVFCYTHGQVAETTLSAFDIERGSVISREWDSATLNNGLIAFCASGLSSVYFVSEKLLWSVLSRGVLQQAHQMRVPYFDDDTLLEFITTRVEYMDAIAAVRAPVLASGKTGREEKSPIHVAM